MTKETKIGLLVGLAFIILFAIILSEKGSPPGSALPPTFARNDAISAPTSDRPLSDAGRLAVDSKLPPIMQPALSDDPVEPIVFEQEKLVQAPTETGADAPILPPSVVDLLNGASSADKSTGPEIEADPAAPIEAPIEKLATGAPDKNLASPSRPLPAAHADETPIDPATTVAASTTRRPAQPAIAPPIKIRTIHTVQPGESLGKIAARYYERSTPDRVNAIFNANRENLDDRHIVRAGQALKIPDLGLPTDQFEPVQSVALSAATNAQRPVNDRSIRIPIPIDAMSNDPAAAPETNRLIAQGPSRRPADAAFQWYEVRPRDTLSSIARKKLGSERLYREIYKLNRDVLTSKDVIRPGMKIRLPVPSVDAGQADTVLSAADFDEP
jgi:nucleoid-associated protein YgaU